MCKYHPVRSRLSTFHDLSTVFVLSKFYFFIRRHWQSTFVIYPTILYLSLTDPHHDVAVHPKSHSLLGRPLGLTAREMYSIRATYLRTPPPPPSLMISPLMRRPHLFPPSVATSGVLRYYYTNVNRHPGWYQSTPPFFCPEY